jgi:CO dehydrogenase maturation factor
MCCFDPNKVNDIQSTLTWRHIMIASLSGKGGTGKTSMAALILDELARKGYSGRVLAVDGDPATTLHLALGFPEPAATLAAVRDAVTLNARAVNRMLPDDTSPTDYVRGKLEEAGVIAERRLRRMPLDFLAMGQGEGPGCFCDVNRALAAALELIAERYTLIIIDNEAGLEHLGRRRLNRVDFFLAVTTPSPTAWAVVRRILDTARQAEIALGETGVIVNRTSGRAHTPQEGLTVLVPHSSELSVLDLCGRPVVELPDGAPARLALWPIVERLCRARPAPPAGC